jgi:hypothetical protein
MDRFFTFLAGVLVTLGIGLFAFMFADIVDVHDMSHPKAPAPPVWVSTGPIGGCDTSAALQVVQLIKTHPSDWSVDQYSVERGSIRLWVSNRPDNLKITTDGNVVSNYSITEFTPACRKLLWANVSELRSLKVMSHITASLAESVARSAK